MTLDEYATHDAFGLAELVRRRETTPGELARLAAEAVARLNPAINAVIEVFNDVVDDPGGSGMNPDGPLYGVPFMIKDIASKAAGRVQSAGMEAWADTVDDADDPLVANARDAGLNLIGRTTCSEGGVTFMTWTRRFGVTRNPWNLDYTSGGSSGGSAAAVAARISPIMGANDGGGSTRCPASWNGLVGLKPSRGLLPMPRGLSEATMPNGVEGILTRTLRDHAVAYDILCKKRPGMGFMAYPEPRQSFLTDLYDTPARRFRVALALGPWGGLPPHPDLVAATTTTATLLQDMGHQVEEVRDNEICDFAALRESFLVWNWLPRRIHSVKAFARARSVTLDSSTLSPVGLRHLEAAGRYDQEDIFRAQVMNDTVTRQWGRFFERFDLILAPAVSILCPLAQDVSYSVFSEAPLDEWINHLLNSVPYTVAGNATGAPAMALPAGLDSNGLPLGVQIYAPWGAEDRLFHISGQIERARPEMFDQVAPLNAGASVASIAAVA